VGFEGLEGNLDGRNGNLEAYLKKAYLRRVRGVEEPEVQRVVLAILEATDILVSIVRVVARFAA